ncbi:Threonine/homoserine/homoserine lactone efflux protein [Shimia gijangensis]|uniref:Threonine/homoserine/homoserine lactone efflux protein n=1 Tax=Shimia gijangensis TaxID=1470563 RepID=A0A1M6EUC3_9RHOB|nr:Threonine/homoserine/homoserine lactone efflux protein [Shimia gijangensis]
MSVRVAASDGFRAAAGLALGFGLGAAFWAAAAITGLALVFQLLPSLLLVLKIAGTGFLFWIALRMWRQASQPIVTTDDSRESMGFVASLRLGVFTAASNAKTAVFFGAIFAGLIPQDTSALWMCAIVSAVFVNETVWYVFVARAFSLPGARAGYIRLKSTIDRAFGGLIALFELKIALS